MTRIAILGCGSVGGVLAARFCRRPDIDLTVINRDPRIAEAAARRGLILHDRGRRSIVHPLIESAVPRGAPPFDAIILATKWEGLLEAARALLPRLTPDGIFVTMQNGLIALDLARVFGEDRVVPGCVLWGASMIAPGEYRLTAGGATIIGSLSKSDERAQAAAAILSAVSPVVISRNIRGVLWSKLAVTASLTSLGAIGGVRFGRLVLQPRVRRLLLAIGREVGAVAAAKGIALEPLGAGFDVPRFLAADGWPDPIRHLMILLLGWKHRRSESGMLASLLRGRRTEVQHVNGRVVAFASAVGVPVPLNRAVTELLIEMEAGKRMPGRHAIDALEGILQAPLLFHAQGPA